MLFNTPANFFESEKERNFYYKVFAGYFCNELIPGYEDRLDRLSNFFADPVFEGNQHPKDKIELMPENTQVSFDNHTYLFDLDNTDRGEFADILIQCPATKTMITIEAKLHSDWDYNKDIESNQKRLKGLKERIPGFQLYPFLLLKKDKWDFVQKMKLHKGSNFEKLEKSDSCMFAIVLWEKLVEQVTEKKVADFMTSQLERNHKRKYRFENEWFVEGA